MPDSQVLYHHERFDYYECLGCHEEIEVPYLAVLKQGKPKEPIKSNPENRMAWLELRSIEHASCGLYKDEEKSRQHREYGLAKTVNRKS